MPETPERVDDDAVTRWQADSRAIEVPKYAVCPDCRASLQPLAVAGWPEKWLMRCPMDGGHFEYQVIA